MLNNEASLIKKFRDIFSLFAAAIKNARFYPPHHSLLVQSIDELYVALANFLKGKPEIVFGFHGGEIFFEKHLLARESITYSSLCDELEEKDIGNLTIKKGVTFEELASFINLFAQDESLFDSKDRQSLLKDKDILSISIEFSSESRKDKELKKEEFDYFSSESHNNYMLALDSFREVAENAKSNRIINVRGVKTAVKAIIDEIFKDRYAILGLTTIKSYDEYTFYHSVNVAILSLALGSMLPLERSQLNLLGEAALLHDIGKVFIPEETLKKPEPLTTKEWKIVQRHPIYGAETLMNISGLDKSSSVVAFEHHAGINLTGYPEIFRKKSIHLFSRIVSIADNYDAITSNRYYRCALLPDQALFELIKGTETTLDPLLLKVFVRLIGIYPIGSLVKLDTGEIGIVFRPNLDDLYRPMIKIVIDSKGNRITPEAVGLTEKPDRDKYKRTIVNSVNPLDYDLKISKYF